MATAARLLGKSERTVRRWVADGKLAADRAGTALLVDIARHMPDTEAATPSGAAAMPDTTGELDALRAEVTRLREALDTCQAERDRLWQSLDNAQAIALALTGEQRLLTERASEARRRWWPPWRREGP